MDLLRHEHVQSYKADEMPADRSLNNMHLLPHPLAKILLCSCVVPASVHKLHRERLGLRRWGTARKARVAPEEEHGSGLSCGFEGVIRAPQASVRVHAVHRNLAGDGRCKPAFLAEHETHRRERQQSIQMTCALPLDLGLLLRGMLGEDMRHYDRIETD